MASIPATQEPNRLGPYLLRLREVKGWKQKDLARQSGVSRSRIASIENAKTQPNPTDYTVEGLAAALDVPLDTFRDEAGLRRRGLPQVDVSTLSEAEARIVNRMRAKKRSPEALAWLEANLDRLLSSG